MTKFILHGGVMSPRSDSNKAFYREMVDGIVNPNILLVYFARELSEYDYLFDRDRGNFKWSKLRLKADYVIASVETFKDDLEQADVIMFAGGDTEKLFEAIAQSGVDLKKSCEGKVVAGSSAGAYLVSQWYYTNSGKEIRKGLGLIDAAAWAHYRADRGNEYYLTDEQIADVERGLTDKVGEDKLALLPEQEFKVYEV